jgi:NAD(P)-dependent dehydrogenase (short-subunit alcohol dehydrogenase family)
MTSGAGAGGTRTTIVTGGTGALGQSVVEAFLAAGDRVIVPWIVEAEAERMRTRFADRARLVLVHADVANEGGAAVVAREAPALGALVNGVGGFAMGPHADTEAEVWDRLYRLNVRAAAVMTRAALPALARGGAIVNVAAAAALDPPAEMGAYTASKAALVAFTRSLAREVAGRGIRVNAVLPTTIDTPANRAAMPDADFSQWTRPEQIAAAIVWLASDAASAVRGALVPV